MVEYFLKHEDIVRLFGDGVIPTVIVEPTSTESCQPDNLAQILKLIEQKIRRKEVRCLTRVLFPNLDFAIAAVAEDIATIAEHWEV